LREQESQLFGGFGEFAGMGADLFEKVGRALVGVDALSGSNTDTRRVRCIDPSVDRENHDRVVALLGICLRGSFAELDGFSEIGRRVNLLDFSTPAVLILLATSASDGQQLDALGLDAPPQIAAGSALDPIRHRPRAYVHSELTAEALAHLGRDLVNLGLLGDGRTRWWDDEGKVNVAPGPTLAASDAAEDVSLPHAAHPCQPSPQKLLQRRLDRRLLPKQLMDSGIHDVAPVQLIEVGAAGSLHSSETYLGKRAQYLGRAVVRYFRTPCHIACADREPLRQAIEGSEYPHVSPGREDVIESGCDSDRPTSFGWYL